MRRSNCLGIPGPRYFLHHITLLRQHLSTTTFLFSYIGSWLYRPSCGWRQVGRFAPVISQRGKAAPALRLHQAEAIQHAPGEDYTSPAYYVLDQGRRLQVCPSPGVKMPKHAKSFCCFSTTYVALYVLLYRIILISSATQSRDVSFALAVYSGSGRRINTR